MTFNEEIKRLEELRNLVLWMQECKALEMWLRKRLPEDQEDQTDMPAFHRWLNAHCSLHRSIRYAEQFVYDWRP
jgi:hypothetical protein